MRPEESISQLQLTCRNCPQHCHRLAYATHESSQHPLCSTCTDHTLASPSYSCANCKPEAFYEAHRKPRAPNDPAIRHSYDSGNRRHLRTVHPLFPISQDLEELAVNNLDVLFADARADRRDVLRFRFFISDIIRAVAQSSRQYLPGPSTGRPDNTRVRSELVIEISHAHPSEMELRGKGRSQGK